MRSAKGLTLRRWGGHRLIAHGGGINGFSAFSSYVPDDSLAVGVRGPRQDDGYGGVGGQRTADGGLARRADPHGGHGPGR